MENSTQEAPKNILKIFSQTAQSLFETLSEMVQKGITVKEIAEMVKNHENTRLKTKTMLGITFHFYKLKINDLVFHLEIKEDVIEKILSFKIYTADHIVLNYRSYEDELKLEDKIKSEHLPQIVKENTK